MAKRQAPKSSVIPVFLQRLICLGIAVVSCSVFALDEFSYDLRLVRELTEIGMTDYAARQVQRMYRKYPEQEDQVRFAQVRVYLATNQRAKAQEILDDISRKSPLYPQARRLIGENAFRRRQFTEAKEAFADYFKVQPQPVSGQRRHVEDFISAVQTYAQVFIELGQAKEVSTALDHLSAVKKTGAISQAEINYLKAKAALAAYEMLQEQGKKINREHIEQLVTNLEDMGLSQDYLIIINSTLETAHAKILLGQYVPAIEKVRSLDELLTRISGRVRPESSPLASAFYYEGEALAGLADEMFEKGERERAFKIYKAAAKRFRRVIDDYAAHRLNDKAVIGFGQIRTRLQDEYDVTIKGPAVSGRMLVKLREADNFFRTQQYEQAIPLYLDALRQGRLSGKAPEIGLRLSYSYAQADNFLEAEAIAGYLADLFPDNTQTAEAMLKLGSIIYEKAKSIEKTERKEEQIDKAIEIWNKFLEIAPEHDQAPTILYASAEQYYRRARAITDQIDPGQSVKEQEDMKARARKIYRQALPYYEQLTEDYGTASRSIRGYYKLGWVYDALEQEKRSAEAFLKYYALETDPDKAKDRLIAKFQAGYQFMMSDTPQAAIDHFKEFVREIEEESIIGINTQAPEIQKMKVDAESYIAWAYDLTAEELRPQVTEINEDIADFNETIAAFTEQQEMLQQKRTAAEKVIAEARQFFEEKKQAITGELPNPELEARQQLADELEKAQSDDEKELVRQRIARETEKNRQRILDTLAGKKQELEKTRKTVQKEYLENQKELKQVNETINTKEAELIKLQDDLQTLKQKTETRREQIKAARKTVTELQNELGKAQSEFEQARSDFEAGDSEARETARAQGLEARKRISNISKELDEARVELEALQTEQKRDELAQWNEQRAMLVTQTERRRKQLRELQERKGLLQHEIQVADVYKKAIARQIEQIDLQRHLVQVPENKREAEAAAKNWTETVEQVDTAFEHYTQARIAKGEFLKRKAEAEIERVKQKIADARQQIAQLEKEREPLTAEINEWKQKAQKQYLAFIEEYPESKHIPANLGRLGTNYMEMGEYAKAQQYLDKLAAEYPEAKALEKALFSLAKAQLETNRTDAAVTTFKKILENKREQSAGSLNYITREILNKGYPELALTAARELLRRSEDPNHKDYEKLSGKTRENILFRAGKAAYEAEQYDQAVEYLSELLKLNEKTAHYYQAKMIMGKAKRLTTPPDLIGSRNDFLDIVQFSTDPLVENKAIVGSAKTFLAMESETGVKQALAQLGQLALVSEGEVLILANEEKQANLPLLEEAVYLSAKCHALLGNDQARDLMIETYKTRFSQGRFLQELQNLPAPKYKAEPVAENTGQSE